MPRRSVKKYTAAQKAAYYKGVVKGNGAYVYRKRYPSRASYYPRVVRGRGAYSFRDFGRDLGRGAKWVGSRIAAPALTAVGSALGGPLGAAAAKGVSTVLGLGAYQVKRNSLLMQGSTGNQVPFMHSARDGFRIRHREFLQDISSSTTFNNNVFKINPGDSSSFPWLSGIAQNFEQYRFDGLIFEYKSTSADSLNSTNTALGTVIGAAEYNSAQAAYVNKQQMENSMWAVSTKPSCDMILPIECDPSMNPMGIQYVRTGDPPSGQDIRMYDVGNAQFATVGSQATAVIGEIWVSYDVVLFKPQMNNGLALSAQSAHYDLGAPANASPFGILRPVVYDQIGLTVSATSITFPVGCQGIYAINYAVQGDSTGLVSPAITLTNCSNVSLITGNSSNGSSTSTSYLLMRYINISDPTLQAVFTLGTAGTLPANSTGGDLIVTQLNGNIS